MLKLFPSPSDGGVAERQATNVARLQAQFPELVTEGERGVSVNVDVLKQLVGDQTVTDADEKFGLNWFGKRKARQLALTPSRGTLRPAPDESVDWDTTKNLMIEGDNLEVLKLLQKSYAGKVKLIYIDPPYNTGKDFVYPDDFRDGIRNYKELTGQTEDGKATSSNTETSGRYHTNWLSMMYPRLKAARDLLQEDGAIFISIDDTEYPRLRQVCDEVFGDENFVATIIWEKKFAPQNDAKWFSDNHDYIAIYAKSKQAWNPQKIQRRAGDEGRFSNPDNDPRGPWASSDMTVRTYSATYDYPIITPSGKEIFPTKGRCWSMPKHKVQELLTDNRIWFGKSGNNVPRIKTFLSELKSGIVPLTIWKHTDVGHNQEARQEVKALGIHSFDSPKPVRLLSQILSVASSNKDIILDFFAGSGSLGHAVISKNFKDQGARRYIVVQLPEPLDIESSDQKAAADFCDSIGKPHTIAELTKERLRRAGAKIKAENPDWKGDTGFRVFKLDSSNIRTWDSKPENLEKSLLDHVTHIKPDRSETDIFSELLLRLGIDLTSPIEEKTITGKTVRNAGEGTLFACLAASISRKDVEPLALGIAEWRQQIAPKSESTVVFRDDAFADEASKANLTAILRQHGFDEQRIRSL